jgi:hypothetical protein
MKKVFYQLSFYIVFFTIFSCSTDDRTIQNEEVQNKEVHKLKSKLQHAGDGIDVPFNCDNLTHNLQLIGNINSGEIFGTAYIGYPNVFAEVNIKYIKNSNGKYSFTQLHPLEPFSRLYSSCIDGFCCDDVTKTTCVFYKDINNNNKIEIKINTTYYAWNDNYSPPSEGGLNTGQMQMIKSASNNFIFNL